MVDYDATLLHELLNVPVTQRVGDVLADANQDNVGWKAQSFEVEHVQAAIIQAPQFTRSGQLLSQRDRTLSVTDGINRHRKKE